jgi:hypothetical protein
MQVAHDLKSSTCLTEKPLDRIVANTNLIFIEIEAIRTERFTITKTRNYRSSSAKAANFYDE